MSIILTTPVARIVQGELWKSRDVKDNRTGLVKIGADGQPQKSWFFAIAIAKQPGHSHWSQTEWGAQIWAEGNRAHPQFAPHPTFSWKIEDGDSQVPNKKGKKNCDREGHPGHWILKLSSNFAIDQTYNANGTAPMPPEAFKTGHYVQVNMSVKGNTGDTPGVYLNPLMVALSGYGQEIASGPDVSEAGFGAAPLPAGASAAPLASALPMPAASAPPAVPSVPAYVAPVAVPSPVPVMPDPSMRAAAVPPAPAYQMTAAAQGFTRDQLVAQGWTDATLRERGMMV
jgi:hypothetical protein